jgi:hypothetical protein
MFMSLALFMTVLAGNDTPVLASINSVPSRPAQLLAALSQAQDDFESLQRDLGLSGSAPPRVLFEELTWLPASTPGAPVADKTQSNPSVKKASVKITR